MLNARALILLATLAFLGCAPKTETTLPPAPPEPNPEPQLANDARERVKELVARSEEYAAGAAKLPGQEEATDRAQVAKQFALLAQILPILNGPDMSGDFRQQLRIIEATRSQLASGSSDLSVEPTIDSGLRAAQRALASINQRAFSDNPDVAKSLDLLRTKNDEIDNVSGPIHRLVASQSFQASAAAIGQMTAALNGRLNEAKPK